MLSVTDQHGSMDYSTLVFFLVTVTNKLQAKEFSRNRLFGCLPQHMFKLLCFIATDRFHDVCFVKIEYNVNCFKPCVNLAVRSVMNWSLSG
jgi:hypothetical protein